MPQHPMASPTRRGAASGEMSLLLVAVGVALLIAATLFGRKLVTQEQAMSEALDGGNRPVSATPVTLDPATGLSGAKDTPGVAPGATDPASVATAAPSNEVAGASPLTSGPDDVSSTTEPTTTPGNAPANAPSNAPANAPANEPAIVYPVSWGGGIVSDLTNLDQDPNTQMDLGRGFAAAVIAGVLMAGPDPLDAFLAHLVAAADESPAYMATLDRIGPMTLDQYRAAVEAIRAEIRSYVDQGQTPPDEVLQRLQELLAMAGGMDGPPSSPAFAFVAGLGATVANDGGVLTAEQLQARLDALQPGQVVYVTTRQEESGNPMVHTVAMGRDALGRLYIYDSWPPGDTYANRSIRDMDPPRTGNVIYADENPEVFQEYLATYSDNGNFTVTGTTTYGTELPQEPTEPAWDDLGEMLNSVHKKGCYCCNALLAAQVAAGPTALRHFLEGLVTALRNNSLPGIEGGKIGGVAIAEWDMRLTAALDHLDAGELTQEDFDRLESLVHGVFISDARSETMAYLMLLGDDVYANAGAEGDWSGAARTRTVDVTRQQFDARLTSLEPGTQLLYQVNNLSLLIGRTDAGEYYVYAQTASGELIVETYDALAGDPPRFPAESAVHKLIGSGADLELYEVYEGP